MPGAWLAAGFFGMRRFRRRVAANQTGRRRGEAMGASVPESLLVGSFRSVEGEICDLETDAKLWNFGPPDAICHRVLHTVAWRLGGC